MERLFDDDDPHTVGQIIRAFFKARGGNLPATDLAKALIADNVLPAGVVDRAALRGIEAMCRKALSAQTREQLPFAQPLGTGRRALWVQLDLFTQSQATGLIRRRIRNLAEDYDVTRRLHVWCLERFGSAPELPELIMPSDDESDPDAARAAYDANLDHEAR